MSCRLSCRVLPISMVLSRQCSPSCCKVASGQLTRCRRSLACNIHESPSARPPAREIRQHESIDPEPRYRERCAIVATIDQQWCTQCTHPIARTCHMYSSTRRFRPKRKSRNGNGKHGMPAGSSVVSTTTLSCGFNMANQSSVIAYSQGTTQRSALCRPTIDWRQQVGQSRLET
jgi:hypothetical protein